MRKRTSEKNAQRNKGFGTITKFVIVLGVLGVGTALFAQFGILASTRTNISLRPIGLDTGLVAHYTFDGEDMGQYVGDASGNDNRGYLVGFVATSTVAGKIGQGLYLDGADYVNINSVADDIAGGSYSFGLWIKAPPVFKNTRFASIIGGNGSASAGNRFIFCIGDNLAGTALDNELCLHDGSAFEGDTDTVVADDTWHYVSYVRSVSTGYLYIDGIQKSTHTVGAAVASDDYVSIGQEFDVGPVPSDFFKGVVDDVRFYDRALSLEEIKKLYELGGNGTKAGVTQAIPPVPNASSSPVAYWTFNGRDTVTGQVNDLSGNNYHGSEKNMSTSTAYVPGRIGQALRFDGVDDRVIIPWLMPGPLGVVNHSSFTIVAWVYPEWNSTAAENTIISQQDGTGNGRFLINIDLPQGLGCTVPAEFVSFLGGAVSCSNISAIKGEWQQVALVVREAGASDTVSFYVNGVFGKTTTQNIGTNDSAGWVIGDKKTFLAPFQGRLDDIRIYDRELSQAELKQLYDSGAPTKAAATQAPPRLADANSGLVGHWTFDGKKLLQNAADSSAQGNTAYLSGFTSTTTVPGRLGQALAFNGASNYVAALDNATLDPTGDLTVATWVKLDRHASAVGASQFLVSKGTTASPFYTYALQQASSNDRLAFCWSGASVSYVCVDTGTIPSLNRWYHLVGVKQGTVLNIYLDGVYSNALAGATGAFLDTNSTLAIGATSFSNQFTKGSLDDVRVYNRALSASEIRQLYEMGK